MTAVRDKQGQPQSPGHPSGLISEETIFQMPRAQCELLWLNASEGLITPWANAFLAQEGYIERTKVEKGLLQLGGRVTSPHPGQGVDSGALGNNCQDQAPMIACHSHTQNLF